MFCPKCKGEYREGFFECADCKIPLVEFLPEEINQIEPKEGIELVKLFETSDQALVAFIQSLFESENIAHFVVGEAMLGAGCMHGGRPADILVDLKQFERAKKLVSELNWQENT